MSIQQLLVSDLEAVNIYTTGCQPDFNSEVNSLDVVWSDA